MKIAHSGRTCANKIWETALYSLEGPLESNLMKEANNNTKYVDRNYERKACKLATQKSYSGYIGPGNIPGNLISSKGLFMLTMMQM